MALIEYDVYKQKLRDLGPELDKLSAALDVESARQEAARLEDETAQDGFWNDLERSQKVQVRLKQLQNKIGRQEKLLGAWEDLTVLCEMGQEADDADILEEVKTEYAALEERVEETRMTTLLSGEYDSSNAIMQFHAGAGGTEAQDWAQMLYRMYTSCLRMILRKHHAASSPAPSSPAVPSRNPSFLPGIPSFPAS